MKSGIISFAPRGGMVDTPARTPDGFAALLRNCYFRAGAWVWRAGAQKLHASVDVDQPVGAWALKTTGPGTPTWTLINATRGASASLPARFGRLVGSAFVGIPYNGTTPPDYDVTDAWRAWRAQAVTDTTLYACRRTYKGGRLYHVTANSVTAAGIAAPAAPAVVDSAGAGVLPAGEYTVSYRFRTAEGMYSPWSPTAVATIGANKKRAWTITTSSHPRVTARELGASYPGATDVFFAHLVNDNTTTTVEEDVLPAAYDLARLRDGDLGLPPENPEDVLMWGGLLWLVSNDPSPALWRCGLDFQGAVWELFDPNKALIPGSSGGQRAVAVRAFDDDRLGLLMDGSVHVVEAIGGDSYGIRGVEGSTGCVSAPAADGGAGWLCWFDGRNVMASRGATEAQIVSRAWVDEALAAVAAADAERSIVKYTPDDGGGFHVCVPQTGNSEPALDAIWRPNDPAGNQWHTRKYLASGVAPTFIGLSPAPAAGQYTIACLPGVNRVFRIDAPTHRDQGPANIAVRIETGALELPDGYGSLAVAAVHIGVRRRADTTLPDQDATVSCDVSLILNDGAEVTTPVTATLTAGTEYLHARANNLQKPRARVQVRLDFDHPDPLEVFAGWCDVVLFRRDEVRT